MTPNQEGTLYRSQNISYVCPKTWTNQPVTDIFSEENPKPLQPNTFFLVNDLGTSSASLSSYPNLKIDYNPETEFSDPRQFFPYEDIEEVELNVKGTIWKGFTCTSMGSYRNAILFRGEFKHLQASFFLNGSEKEIHITDEEVINLLASIQTWTNNPTI